MPEQLTTKAETFEVVSIDQMTRPDPRGGVKDTYLIRFITKGGITLTRELGAEEMTDKKFTEALTQEAQKFDKLKSLRG